MATKYPSDPTAFPGWHVISLLLPLVTILGAIFILNSTPRREGQWFPDGLGVALRVIDIAAILGLAAAVFALIRRDRGADGPLAALPPFAHIGIAAAGLLLNVVIVLYLNVIPWKLK